MNKIGRRVFIAAVSGLVGLVKRPATPVIVIVETTPGTATMFRHHTAVAVPPPLDPDLEECIEQWRKDTERYLALMGMAGPWKPYVRAARDYPQYGPYTFSLLPSKGVDT